MMILVDHSGPPEHLADSFYQESPRCVLLCPPIVLQQLHISQQQPPACSLLTWRCYCGDGIGRATADGQAVQLQNSKATAGRAAAAAQQCSSTGGLPALPTAGTIWWHHNDNWQ
jgi:hypothetical protein